MSGHPWDMAVCCPHRCSPQHAGWPDQLSCCLARQPSLLTLLPAAAHKVTAALPPQPSEQGWDVQRRAAGCQHGPQTTKILHGATGALLKIRWLQPFSCPGNQRYPADTAGEPPGHNSCLTSSTAALKNKTKQNKKPPYTGFVMKSQREKQSEQQRKCACTMLKHNFSITQSPVKDFSEMNLVKQPSPSAPDPTLLTLLLLFPAVISEVCDIVVFHAPFNILQVRARVFVCKVLRYIVGDFQVLCHSPVYVTHRPRSRRRGRTGWDTLQGQRQRSRLFRMHNVPRYQTTENTHHSYASTGLKVWEGEAFLVEMK